MAAAVLLTAAIACGHKGDPLPPDHPPPPAVGEFAIERVGSDVTLRFTMPDPQPVDRGPRLFERVEIFALTKTATQPAATSVELLGTAHQIAAVHPPVKAKTSEDEPPAQAVPMTFTDTLPATTSEEAGARYYAAQAVNGKRRGPLSLILKVPLDTTPAIPTKTATTYDEHALTLSWVPGQDGQQFLVDETDSSGATVKRLTPAPLGKPAFETPVEFGRPQCFIVRAIQTHANVTIVGAPTAPVCVTAVDRFPPDAPTDLVASAGDTAVDLSWTASTATDVAAYIILRADGANGTLQPLTPKAITAVTFSDTTVKSGVTYEYAVKAVDRAGNESALSNRYTVTARGER
jgi:hypothetical protein